MGRTISSQDTLLDIPTPTTLLPTQKLVLVSNIWNQDMFAVLQIPLDSLQERRLYSLLWFFVFIYLLCAYMGARVHMRRSQDNLQVLALLPPSGSWESNSGHHDCWQEPLLSGTACKLYFVCWLSFSKTTCDRVTNLFQACDCVSPSWRAVGKGLVPELLVEPPPLGIPGLFFPCRSCVQMCISLSKRYLSRGVWLQRNRGSHYVKSLYLKIKIKQNKSPALS